MTRGKPLRPDLFLAQKPPLFSVENSGELNRPIKAPINY